MKKPKLLCILHRSPPAHGAAKVGDFIAESKKLKEEFNCRFITIKSSDTISDIGKINFKKIYLVAELYLKVLWMFLVFRPNKLYFTASVGGIAMYRDLFLCTLWKIYRFFTHLDIYYHYHTKGIDKFVSSSARNLKLTNFFVKDVHIVLLSSLLKKDVEKLRAYKSIKFLPNGVENFINNNDFDEYINKKYEIKDTIQALYLAHMMRDKGYWEVLELAQKNKEKNIHFHFAGSWKDERSEKEFFDYIKEHKLEKIITYHGFVSGEQKKELFENAHILLYPSKNDAFPLTLLESLSYGVPVLATNEGSISYLLDEHSGIVINDVEELAIAFDNALQKFVNIETAIYCRKRYLENFSLEQFEENLVRILK
jgi:glycosyltransferase involved in cell wall biosynthesis